MNPQPNNAPVPQPKREINANYYGKRAAWSLVLALPGIAIMLAFILAPNNDSSGFAAAFILAPVVLLSFFALPISVVYAIAYLVKNNLQRRKAKKGLPT
jgi:uncharacterized membrane protein